MLIRNIINAMSGHPQDSEIELLLIRPGKGSLEAYPRIDGLQVQSIQTETYLDAEGKAKHKTKLALRINTTGKVVAIDETHPATAEEIKKMSTAMDSGAEEVRRFDKAEFGPAMPYKPCGTRAIFTTAPRYTGKLSDFSFAEGKLGFMTNYFDKEVESTIAKMRATQPVFPGQVVRLQESVIPGAKSPQMLVAEVTMKILPVDMRDCDNTLRYYWECECVYLMRQGENEGGLPAGNIPWPYLEFDELSKGSTSDLVYDVKGRVVSRREMQGPTGSYGPSGPTVNLDGYDYTAHEQAKEGKPGEP